METTKSTVKVGLIGVGLNTYWEQFEGLLPRLLGYQKEIKEKMHRLHADVVDAGMVDTPQKAIDATTLMQNNGIEIAFIFISTYALSSTILPIAQRIKVPIVLLNVQPVSAIDYQLINSMDDRAGIHYDIVTGYLQEDIVWKVIVVCWMYIQIPPCNLLYSALILSKWRCVN